MRKQLKTILVLLLAMVMALGTATLAYAEDTSSPGSGSEKPAATITSHSTEASYAKKSLIVNYKGENAESYEIQYRLKGGKWKTITTTDSSYTIKNLKAKGLYQVRVRGINADGKAGKWSTTIYRFMQNVKPTVKSQKTKTVTVTASLPSGASGYQIRYSLKSNMKSAKTVTVSSKKALNKLIKSLKKGKTYYVTVRCISKSGGKTYLGVQTAVKRVKVK